MATQRKTREPDLALIVARAVLSDERLYRLLEKGKGGQLVTTIRRLFPQLTKPCWDRARAIARELYDADRLYANTQPPAWRKARKKEPTEQGDLFRRK